MNKKVPSFWAEVSYTVTVTEEGTKYIPIYDPVDFSKESIEKIRRLAEDAASRNGPEVCASNTVKVSKPPTIHHKLLRFYLDDGNGAPDTDCPMSLQELVNSHS